MNKMLKAIGVLSLIVAFTATANAQKVGKFGADMGKKSVMGKSVRVPYTHTVKYLGFVEPGVAPDGEVNGKKMYYLYVWIPAAAPEIGVRMISPVPSGIKTGKGDIVSDAYDKNKSDTESYFDTWISFEKAKGITKLDDVQAKAGSAEWKEIGHNDDSGELHAQPSGNKYNSVLRMESDVKNPLKALTAGLYRVGFTTYKKGEVKGSFYAEIGAPVKLPGVIVAKDITDIKK